jgi:cation transport protein ChaC
MQGADELWVFGYGSLIWHPGIAVAETRPATLHGYRRRFCMWSIHHRGTEDRPGLVLALEPHEGASCEGLAIRAAHPEPALAELRERELISSAYVEARLDLTTPDGPLEAITYVINQDHEQYVQHLTLDEQAQIITRATGGRGPNRDYLHNTAMALAKNGIEDSDIRQLCQMVPN